MDLVRRLATALGHDPDAPREPPAAEPSEPEPPVAQPLLVVSGAYHPGDRGMAAGANHYTVTRALDVGRLHRAPKDALCKPRARFWGLYAHPEREASCARCIEIATRLGLLPAKGATS